MKRTFERGEVAGACALKPIAVLIALVAVWNLIVVNCPDHVLSAEPPERKSDASAKSPSDLKQVKIQANDVIAKLGEPFVVKAKLERKGFMGLDRDLGYRTLEFYSGKDLLDTSITDEEGKAEISLEMAAAKEIEVTIRFPGGTGYQECTAECNVFAFDDSREIMIVDIDHTVADVSSLGFLTKKRKDQQPLHGSVEALDELAEYYQIIFLTHRSTVFADKTKKWLRGKGFPQAPTVFWRTGHEPISALKYKTRKVAELKQRFSNITVGIGDRRSDAEAYLHSDITAYILKSENSGKKYPEGTVLVKDWKEILALLKPRKIPSGKERLSNRVFSRPDEIGIGSGSFQER